MARREQGYRKMDTWEKKTKGGQLFVVFVYYRKDEDHRRLRAVCEHPECTFSIDDTDLDALEDAVDKKVAAAADLKWERKLYVTVKGKDRHTNYGFDAGANLIIEYSFVEIAMRDGSQVHRLWKQGKGVSTQEREITTGPFLSNDKQYGMDKTPDVMGALIDDTPENRAGIEALMSGMAELRSRIMGFLSPEMIETSLSKALGNLLPAQIEHKES